MGLATPCSAPTAPKAPLPSIMLASHSTEPMRLKFEPTPALVNGLSCVCIYGYYIEANSVRFLCTYAIEMVWNVVAHFKYGYREGNCFPAVFPLIQ